MTLSDRVRKQKNFFIYLFPYPSKLQNWASKVNMKIMWKWGSYRSTGWDTLTTVSSEAKLSINCQRGVLIWCRKGVNGVKSACLIFSEGQNRTPRFIYSGILLSKKYYSPLDRERHQRRWEVALAVFLRAAMPLEKNLNLDKTLLVFFLEIVYHPNPGVPFSV